VFKACDSKLLEILPSVWYNFNNLLKRKQFSRKTSIVCHMLDRHGMCHKQHLCIRQLYRNYKHLFLS